MKNDAERPLSQWWRRTLFLVLACGFTALLGLTAMTYLKAPPIPKTVVDEAGVVLFTGEDISNGQEVFFQRALMEHGSLWGHGAYLGPDYSASYLKREAEITRGTLAAERFKKPVTALSLEEHEAANIATRHALKANRLDAATGVLVYTSGESESYKQQIAEWNQYFANGAPGLTAGFINDPQELKALTSFFAWAAWASRAQRPGKTYSYTSNWPYEPLAGNVPIPQATLWSAVSLVFLLSGLGLVLFIFGKFGFLGWKGDSEEITHQESLAGVSLLQPGQRAICWYFLVIAALFLLQTLMGGAIAHYRVEPAGFYGLDLARFLPYNLLRTWHLQLAIFWIATAWVGGGLFIAPIIGGQEPRGYRAGVVAVLVALAIVVFGSMGGEALGINGLLGRLWFWFGHQGSEYLDLGRFWQVLLAVGLAAWLVLMFRALAPAWREPKRRELAILLLASATAIVVFYVPAFFFGSRTNFAIIDHWRFWIIHLWVEGFFELFATVLVALMLCIMGAVSTRTAKRVIYLDAILYMSGGILGTAHHWYFTGQETSAMALGACFSALEVVPLTLLTLDAWDFIRLQKTEGTAAGESAVSKQKWAIYFLMAVGVWNFVGAGVFGFLINLPIVSYFEMGTTLTANHGHAAMFGVFGMLALAVVVFCLRASLADAAWAKVEGYFRFSFWGLNIGLLLMVVLNLFPAGVMQLYAVMQHGYAYARSPEFTMQGFYHISEWMRLLGDFTFLLAGAIPFAVGTLLAMLRRSKAGTPLV